MTRFAAKPVRFGRRPADQGDEVDGLPTPTRIKLQARRAAGIAEAQAITEYLPAPGESVHCLFTARMDLTDLIGAILNKMGHCSSMRIATLGYGQRNLRKLIGFLDAGSVASLGLVASLFFRAHEKELWTHTLSELRARKQRAACCGCHAKVVTMHFATGEKLTIESSANLRASGSQIEQLTLFRDDALYDWHARWIEALIEKHEGRSDE